MRNMANNKILIISSVFFLLFFLSVANTNAVNSYVPPYILNLYNASYYVSNYTVNQTTTQNITGACGTGFVLQNVSNGVFQCVVQASGGGSGTVTSIVFRNGFNQTTITTSGTVDLNYTAVQQRVNESCASGSSIRAIALDGSVTCETDSSGSGTVTSVATGYGLYGGTITTSGTLYVNLTELTTNFGNWSADKPNYATITYVLGVNNLSYSQIASNIGNWSADKSSYATISYVNAVNNVSLSTIQGLINANGNYSQDANAIYTNITALQTSNTTIFSWITGLYNNITSLFTSNTTTNARIDSINTTKSGIGDCPSGQFVQNLTTGTPQCFTPPTGGTPTATNIYKIPFLYYNDFYALSSGSSAGATLPWAGATNNGGTVAVVLLNDNDHIGIFNLSVITATNYSGYYLMINPSNQNTFQMLNDTFAVHIFKPICATVHPVNDTYIRVGFGDTNNNATPQDGLYFNVSTNNMTTFNFTAIARNNSVESRNTTLQLPCNQWYNAQIYVVNNTRANFFVYNQSGSLVLDQVLSERIPHTVGRESGHGISAMVKGLRYTAQGLSLVQVDAMQVGINRTLVR